MDRDNVIKGLEELEGFLFKEYTNIKAEESKIYYDRFKSLSDALALLKEQENLLKEYEKLSQVCFKIEKYLRIADLSILIDRMEEGKVEVLQEDGRPDSMETTIKIRRL